MDTQTTTLEWRLVDGAGAPFDTGHDLWPIYQEEQDAKEALALSAPDHPDEGLHLEVREVQPWRDAR